MERLVERILTVDDSPKRMLDAGCSLGQLTAGLATLPITLTAIDVSVHAVRRARVHLQHRSVVVGKQSRVQFIAGSTVELPFADEAFDIIVASDGLYSWDLSAADRATALGELRRVLRRGGQIVLTEHMRLHRFDHFIAEVRASEFCVRRIEYLYDRPSYQFESWIRAIQDWRMAKALRRSVGLARALRALGRIGGRRASRHVCVLAARSLPTQ